MASAAVIVALAGSGALLASAPAAVQATVRTATLTTTHTTGHGHAGPIYRSVSYSPEERAADLVARMTTSEKASQMVSGQAPPIPRLGVHGYGWWNESQHGVAYLQLTPTGSTTPLVDTTSYPVNLALGSTWDPGLMYREASAISDEAREVAPGNVFNLDYFAPTINLARDPRWGRNDETFSEDPALTAAIASQYVNGMEGKDQQGRLLPEAGGYLKTIATLKHYALNNSEVNRLNGSSDVDERTLREYYTDAFRLIIEHSHPGALMAAFNSVDGIPASANDHLLDTLARQTFGFDGYVASDCDGISAIVGYHRWRPPGWSRPVNNTEAHALANAAGVDLNCTAGTGDVLNARTLLPAAVSEGIRTQSDTYNSGDLDNSLVRLFTARMRLGEFDRTAAEPWVKAARAQIRPGSWVNSDANRAVTETPARLQLAREVADRGLVLLKNAATTRRDGTVGPILPLRIPRSGPFRVAVIGALANSSSTYLGGYSSVQGPAGAANEVTPYAGIKRAIQALNPNAVVDFYSGFTGGTNAAGLVNIDQSAVQAAAGYDDVIVYAGTDRSTAGEDADRPTLTLPGAQSQLIADVAAANPNTVAVMETVGQVELGGFGSQVPAMVWSSYNGQRQGDALADVLLGRYDPSGHLPFTWYQSTSDLPAITDYGIRPATGNPGRTYMYYQGPVSYPFGYGLSYTTFRASSLQIDHPTADANDTVHVSLQVTNTGAVSGKDLVQLYVTPPRSAAWLQPPTKRLAAFRQVPLAPGQTRAVTFTLRVADLALFNPRSSHYTVFDGRYGLQISGSAANADVQLGAWLPVHGRLKPVPSVVSAKPTMPGDATRGIQSRVMFPEDEVVLPQLTVAMNDDELYGYLGGRHIRALPPRTRLRYSSDNAKVVSVDKHGLIRTLRNGVATITATVTYNGTSRATQFVIRVLSELDQLSVDGTPLPAFAPDVHDYDVIVPKFRKPRKQPKGKKGHKQRPQRKLPAIPRITVKTPDRSARVRIAQAEAIPGTARVTITGPDGLTQTYDVHLARPATGDEFSGPGISPAWSWLRPDPTTAHLVPGSLVLGAGPGDLTTHTARNVLLQPALGDWAIQSRLTFSLPPHADTQQAGIIAYQDDGDYLKLDWEYRSGAPRLTLTSSDGISGAPVGQVLASLPTAGGIGTSLWLRMVKSGPRYTTYYSADGVHFVQLYSVGASLSDVNVGLFAFSGASTLNDLSVAFDYFRVSQSGLTLGSNGSLRRTSPRSIR